MKNLFRSIGPAIIVAAVVLGPGSILTSSKVGASFGYIGVPVICAAAFLMIAMVALSARIGVIFEKSPCDELAARLGRPVAVAVGLILFLLVAIFQNSNNIAVAAGLELLLEKTPGAGISTTAKIITVVVMNALVIASLYLMRNLYSSVEKLMKILIGLIVISFLFNFVVAHLQPRSYEPVVPAGPRDWIPLLGMIGTTFSVGGAFYQAYLVKEKGWGIADAKKGVVDSVVSISLLGLVTIVILLTATRIFYGNPGVTLGSVGDVARQLEPLFGSSSKVIFAIGILAGAASSFLVNAMIGGTVMADSLGKGSRLTEKWPLHLTTVALLCGMVISIFAMRNKESTVNLITFAQACTVLGIPALAAALIYLGTRKDLTGDRKVPRWILVIAIIGFIVACGLAVKTALTVYDKIM